MAGFSKKQLEEMAESLKKQAELQERLSGSVNEYAKALKEVADNQANIRHISEQIAKIKSDELNNVSNLNILLKDRNKGNKAEIEARRQEILLLTKKIKLQRASVSLGEQSLENLKEQNSELVESLNNVNRTNLALKAANTALGAVPGLIKKGYGMLKSTGVFEMDKSIRMAALEMGKSESSSTGFGKNIGKAADNTALMGINMKDLAKMQANFSTELGRSVVLSQSGLEAMGEMAAGTMLGVDGVSALASEMDRFNISTESTRDLLEETVNMSEKMGINSTKVLKTLQDNLKMANKYHFKGGVAGMVKMATTAAKFNVSMETTAAFADKLFDIEGAVEMSAKLNTMGGEWAKLGDPMKLMFQARNDMEGLQESVIGATAGMADFNATTGEFSFSGLELHRMRELEKITGISADQMAEMAKNKAKFAKIQGDLGFSVAGDDDMKEFIENSAVFNKDTKQFEITLSGQKEAIPIKQLTATHKDMMIADAKSLKKRAEESQTFDDTLQNTISLFKQALLPILDGVNSQLPKIQGLIKELVNSGWVDKIKDFAKMLGNVAGKFIGVMLDWPKTTGAILTGILGGKLLWNLGKWIASGVALAKGFNATARVNGGGGGGGADDGTGGIGSRTTAATRAGKGMSGRLGKFGKSMAGKGGVGGAIGAIGGMAMDYGRQQLDDPNGEGGKAMGVASGALSGAGTGAMIGSVIPVVGTAAGAIIGGLVGGIYSAIGEYGSKSGPELSGKALNDGVVMDGKVTPFDKKDDVLKFQKKGGAFDKNTSSSSSPGIPSGGTTKIHISFDEIKVTGSNGDVGKLDLSNDSIFIRELATKIKESLSITANGGVLSPNPSK